MKISVFVRNRYAADKEDEKRDERLTSGFRMASHFHACVFALLWTYRQGAIVSLDPFEGPLDECVLNYASSGSRAFSCNQDWAVADCFRISSYSFLARSPLFPSVALLLPPVAKFIPCAQAVWKAAWLPVGS